MLPTISILACKIIVFLQEVSISAGQPSQTSPPSIPVVLADEVEHVIEDVRSLVQRSMAGMHQAEQDLKYLSEVAKQLRVLTIPPATHGLDFDHPVLGLKMPAPEDSQGYPAYHHGHGYSVQNSKHSLNMY